MTLHLLLAAALVFAAPVAFTASTQSPSPAQSPVAIPDTPAGQALKEFVTTFNEGGEKRRAWLEARTTMDKEDAAGILKQDTGFLTEHGAATVVRVMPKSSATTIMAILRHAKTGAHGHLTIHVEAAAPYKVSNMQLRAATPEEIKGS